MTESPSPRPARSRFPRPVLAAAAFVLVFAAAYNHFVFERVPHVHDEAAYLFQARIFLGGHLTAPAPPAPASFDFPHMIIGDRWYSMYPPGFPFLLALGLVFGAPWLVNPLLGALAILLLYLIGVEIYGRRVGLAAAVLGALSIWHLLMSSTMMSHTASMTFNAAFLLFAWRSFRRPTVSNGLAAGAALGFAYLSRPYNAAVFALPFLAVLAFRTLRDLRGRWRNALAFAVPAALAGAAFFLYNAGTTGDPFLPGYIARYGKAYAVIFGRAATLDFDFTPLASFMQIGENMASLNETLFGWPLTSFWLLLFVLWAARARPADRGKDLLLFSGFISLIVGFFFFWGAFIFIGARMFYDGLPLLVLLSAKGLVEAETLLAGRFPRLGPAGWRKVLAVVLAAFTLYAFAVRFPAWSRPAASEWYYARYDRNMAGSSAGLRNALAPFGLRNAVVIVKFMYAPLSGFPTGWWTSGFFLDTPSLDGDVIYANDRGPAANEELARSFPDRTFYIYAGTLEKGLLLPLARDGGALLPEKPLVSRARPPRSLELVDAPEKIFRPYSPGFRAFLEGSFRTEGVLGVDVAWLMRTGIESQAKGEHLKATYAFEAALQLDKNPKTRGQILLLLGQSYLKSGQHEEAKRLIRKFQEVGFEERRMYFVLPERGF